MGVIILEATIALLLAVAGYAAAVYRLKGISFSSGDLTILKPVGRNRWLYIAATVIAMALAVAIFRSVYADNPAIQQIKLLALIALLLPTAVVDLRTQKIPNSFLLSSLVIWAALTVIEVIFDPADAVSTLIDSFIAGAIIGAFFLVLLLVSRNGIGMGDVKLFAVIGLYQGVWGAVSSVFASMLVSFVVAIVLLIARKKGKKDAMPFAPCIFAGTFISIVLTGM